VRPIIRAVQLRIRALAAQRRRFADIGCELHSEEALRKECPFLFVDPEKAATHLAWGKTQIGEDRRLKDDELLHLL
jgi:hypothetical protein